MNTLIVSLVIYRNMFLKNLQSSSNYQGFTLLELLITVVILGILAAFAFPSYVSVVDKSKYGEAKSQMGCMAKELKVFKLENGYYPKDVSRDIVPDQAITCFYTSASGKVPLNSKYDYEGRNQTIGGQRYCAISIVYLGKDVDKTSGSGDYNSSYNYTNPQFYKNGDDVIFTVDLDLISNTADCQ